MLSFNLGPLAISVGQALLIFAFLIALAVGKFAARRRDVPISDTLFRLALVGFVAARIGFVVHYFGSYGFDPIAWIDVRDGGFEIFVGLLVVAFYASFVDARRPAMRGPLGAALLAGALAWGLTGGVLSLIENQAERPPEAELYALDGGRTDLASLQQRADSRPMVVNLWATWCPPCRAEMPVLEQAQKERPDVLFVFANQAEDTSTIEQFLDQMNLELNHVLRDRRGEVARQAGSAALPTTLFYDASGRLVGSHLGQLSKATLTRALERFDRPADNNSVSSKETP